MQLCIKSLVFDRHDNENHAVDTTSWKVSMPGSIGESLAIHLIFALIAL